MNFEFGTKVKVNTPDGIVEGVITNHYRNTYTNQFAVEFSYPSAQHQKMIYTFSKKTGLAYNHREAKEKNIKVIF